MASDDDNTDETGWLFALGVLCFAGWQLVEAALKGRVLDFFREDSAFFFFFDNPVTFLIHVAVYGGLVWWAVKMLRGEVRDRFGR